MLPSRRCHSSSSADETSGSAPGWPSTSATSASTSSRSTSRPARRAGSSIARRSSSRSIGPTSTWLAPMSRDSSRIRGAAAVVVGAHGDDDQCAPAHVPHGRHERVDERRALGLVAAGREHLLELVDRHDQPAVVGRRGERLLERAQRMLSGTQHGERPALAAGQHPGGERSEQTGVQCRGLAAAGRPDDPQERGARHPRDQLGHEPLAPEEEACVAGLERGQPLVRADSRLTGRERVQLGALPGGLQLDDARRRGRPRRRAARTGRR